MKKLLILLVAFVALATTDSFAFSQKIYIHTVEDGGQVVVEYNSPGCSQFYYQLHIYRAADDNMPWRWLYARINTHFSNNTGVEYVLNHGDVNLQPGQHAYKNAWSDRISGYNVSYIQVLIDASWGGYASAKVSW